MERRVRRYNMNSSALQPCKRISAYYNRTRVLHWIDGMAQLHTSRVHCESESVGFIVLLSRCSEFDGLLFLIGVPLFISGVTSSPAAPLASRRPSSAYKQSCIFHRQSHHRRRYTSELAINHGNCAANLLNWYRSRLSARLSNLDVRAFAHYCYYYLCPTRFVQIYSFSG